MPDDHVNRSAETGKFVSDEEAAEHPATTVRESVADEVNAPLPELVGFDSHELAALEAHFTRYFAPFGVAPGKPGATPLRTARYKIEQALAIEQRDMERARRHADDQGGGTF